MLLAFDTATSRVTVALYDGGVVSSWESADAMRHGEQLGPGIERVLDRAGAISRDVTAVAVGVGPGPFTGLRVGLVTARTLAFALDVPVYGVCTLDVLAAEAVDAGMEDFLVATDARRKEVYLARYAGGVRTGGPEVGRPRELATALATDLPVVGRGAELYPDCFPDRAGPLDPSAAVLAAIVHEERFELLDPEPLYLRRPDAVAPGAPKRVS